MLISQIAQWLSIAASAATVLALFAVWVQIRSAARMQEQSAAMQLYADFLKFGAEYSTVLNKEDLEPGSQYDWAMYLGLTALEGGWLAFDGNRGWRRRLASFARQNHSFLDSDYYRGVGDYEVFGVNQDFDPKFTRALKDAVDVENKRMGRHAKS
jgi:hypothetical protein